ncbi:hypothetical protein BDZ45DRAFT_748011 [Acephala macrosclerotiorum]|nr:hypothetical protein BDZ45DRAFT_748011 [Acephala macrosclerotiorum]
MNSFNFQRDFGPFTSSVLLSLFSSAVVVLSVCGIFVSTTPSALSHFVNKDAKLLLHEQTAMGVAYTFGKGQAITNPSNGLLIGRRTIVPPFLPEPTETMDSGDSSAQILVPFPSMRHMNSDLLCYGTSFLWTTISTNTSLGTGGDLVAFMNGGLFTTPSTSSGSPPE